MPEQVVLPEQVCAIDWSGALAPAAQRRGIAVAACELVSGAVTLRRGLLRAQVEAELAALAAARAQVVVGLDFSFSLPAWFVRGLGCANAPALWERVARGGESWLREPHPEFWGRRRGSGPPPGHRGPEWQGYRACERAIHPAGRLPQSSFQIGGAGAVGTGSLRGMPMLARLHAAGWRIWPFDPPGFPLLVEIYPRALTGPVVKSSAAARAIYLQQPLYRTLPQPVLAAARASEDAFDALISALAMRGAAPSFATLSPAADEDTRLEGAIWLP